MEQDPDGTWVHSAASVPGRSSLRDVRLTNDQRVRQKQSPGFQHHAGSPVEDILALQSFHAILSLSFSLSLLPVFNQQSRLLHNCTHRS